MRSKKWLGNLYLLIAAFLWGSTFVAQAETTVGPFTYIAARSYVGALVLLPVIALLDHRRKQLGTFVKPDRKLLVTGGVLCGVALFVASALQQAGITYGTDPGKAGFITAMYILIVPVLGLLFKKHVPGRHWICVGLGVIGLFMLCMTGGLTEFSLTALFSADTLRSLTLQSCDVYVIVCAVVYSVHILLLDHYSPRVDPVRLSQVQFLVTAVIATVAALLFEQPSWAEIVRSGVSILYAGVLSSGVAYTLQAVAQRYADPTVASMLMSLESTFAVLSAIVFYAITTGNPKLPTGYEWLGIAFMFVAIMLSQWPERKRKQDQHV